MIGLPTSSYSHQGRPCFFAGKGRLDPLLAKGETTFPLLVFLLLLTGMCVCVLGGRDSVWHWGLYLNWVSTSDYTLALSHHVQNKPNSCISQHQGCVPSVTCFFALEVELVSCYNSKHKEWIVHVIWGKITSSRPWLWLIRSRYWDFKYVKCLSLLIGMLTLFCWK